MLRDIFGITLLVGFLITMIVFIICGLLRCPLCGGWHDEDDCENEFPNKPKRKDKQ